MINDILLKIDVISIGIWSGIVLIRPMVVISAIAPPGALVIELLAAAITVTALMTGHLARHTLVSTAPAKPQAVIE